MYPNNSGELPVSVHGRSARTGDPDSDLLENPKVLPSSELLGEKGELLIEHNGCQYSLRLTRQNKLILTK